MAHRNKIRGSKRHRTDEQLRGLARAFLATLHGIKSDKILPPDIEPVLAAIEHLRYQRSRKSRMAHNHWHRLDAIERLACLYRGSKGPEKVLERDLEKYLLRIMGFPSFGSASRAQIKRAVVILQRGKKAFVKATAHLDAGGGAEDRTENHNMRVDKYGYRDLAAINIEAVLRRLDPANLLASVKMGHKSYRKIEKQRPFSRLMGNLGYTPEDIAAEPDFELPRISAKDDFLSIDEEPTRTLNAGEAAEQHGGIADLSQNDELAEFVLLNLLAYSREDVDNALSALVNSRRERSASTQRESTRIARGRLGKKRSNRTFGRKG